MPIDSPARGRNSLTGECQKLVYVQSDDVDCNIDAGDLALLDDITPPVWQE
jgi:hypothetical protein